MNVQLMTIPDAKQVTTWKYPQEYSFYDFDHSPETLQELLDGTPIMQFEIIMVSLRASSVSGLMHQVPEGRKQNLYKGEIVMTMEMENLG